MHTLAIYNLKNWELAFSQSNSSFKLELGLWNSNESRITGKKKTLKKLCTVAEFMLTEDYALTTAGQKRKVPLCK